MSKTSIFAISGSLRKDSYNTATLKKFGEIAKKEYDFDFKFFDKMQGLPLFNQDNEKNPITIVKEFKVEIENADFLAISTPEYNHSISGVLKNAIDWASRPYGNNSLSGQKVIMMGASTGKTGTARAQIHLREILFTLRAEIVNKSEILISQAAEKFSNEGKLTDNHTIEKFNQILKGLED